MRPGVDLNNRARPWSLDLHGALVHLGFRPFNTEPGGFSIPDSDTVLGLKSTPQGILVALDAGAGNTTLLRVLP